MDQTPREPADRPPTQQNPAQPKRGFLERMREWNQRCNLDAQATTLVSLIGAALLGFSFQATSSNISIVTTGVNAATGTVGYTQDFAALCAGGTLVVQVPQKPGPPGPVFGGGCPAGQMYPVAAVTRESRAFFLWGWVLMIVGAIFQMKVVSRSRLALR